jgi:hypothetical protein
VGAEDVREMGNKTDPTYNDDIFAFCSSNILPLSATERVQSGGEGAYVGRRRTKEIEKVGIK